MSQSASTTSSGGIGFAGLLTIVFITLKLLDKIDWSWWWVFSPLWIPALLCVGLLSIAGAIYGAAKLAVWAVKKRR